MIWSLLRGNMKSPTHQTALHWSYHEITASHFSISAPIIIFMQPSHDRSSDGKMDSFIIKQQGCTSLKKPSMLFCSQQTTLFTHVIGHANNIPTMQFSLEFPEILSQNFLCSHWLSLSGNSEIMYCGILINVPFTRKSRHAVNNLPPNTTAATTCHLSRYQIRDYRSFFSIGKLKKIEVQYIVEWYGLLFLANWFPILNKDPSSNLW